MLGALADLILPASCAGCGDEHVPLRRGACATCVAELEALRPFETIPYRAPAAMPLCVATGRYAGAVRGALLAYKERGRHRLAGPLGALLATSVADLAARHGTPGAPVVLVPVPSTAQAARARNGDHMNRMCTHAVRRLRAAGWDASVARVLRASPRPDSASLDVAGRAAAAESSLRIRPSGIRVSRYAPTMRSTLIVVDDIVTTGATLAAVVTRLREVNMQVTGAAVVAATQLRRSVPRDMPDYRPAVRQGPEVLPTRSRTRGDGRASTR